MADILTLNADEKDIGKVTAVVRQLVERFQPSEDLAGAATPTTTQIISGAGLTGGGDLSANRTLAVGAGTGITVNADDVALSDMAAATIKLRASGAGTGAPIDGTGAQANAIIGAVTVIRHQGFTSSGTYTPHANMVYCIMECLGPGGSGAGGTGTNPGWKVGGGGGSGGYSRTIASKATVGASQTVTVSAGGTAPAAGNNDGNPGAGDTSIGTLCVAKPGSGGKYAQSANNPIGGSGGVSGTGDIAASGHCGQGGVNASIATCLVYVGQGADTIWGTGGLQATQGGGGSSTTGNPGAGYGAGGGGGNANSTTSTFAGGNGMPGLAVVTEFCSA